MKVILQPAGRSPRPIMYDKCGHRAIQPFVTTDTGKIPQILGRKWQDKVSAGALRGLPFFGVTSCGTKYQPRHSTAIWNWPSSIQTAHVRSVFPAEGFLAGGSKPIPSGGLTCAPRIGASGRRTHDLLRLMSLGHTGSVHIQLNVAPGIQHIDLRFDIAVPDCCRPCRINLWGACLRKTL